MESVLKKVNVLSLSLRKRKQLVFSGSIDDVSPEVESVVNRVREKLVNASEAEALASVTALSTLRREHNALRKEFARNNRVFSSYVVPELRREDFFPTMPGDSSDEDERPPAHGEILTHPPFERARLGLKLLEETFASYLACSSLTRVLEKTKLEAKTATAKALLNMLEGVRIAREWHPLDILDLDELVMSLSTSVKSAEDALTVPVSSTPGLAAVGAYFPWNSSTVLAASNGSILGNGSGGVLTAPNQPNPNVTQVNLPVTPVTTRVPDPVAETSSTGDGSGGGSTMVAGAGNAFPSGPTQFPTNALYANWYQQSALTDMMTFSGKISEYLEWRETTVQLLNQDTRGPLHSYKTLKPLVQGAAAEKIAHIRATNPQAVAEVFRILDEALVGRDQQRVG